MTNNLVEINKTTLGIKEYNGQRVITFKDIDRVHERPDGTARKAFNRNKKRFIKDNDYYVITRNTPMSVLDTLGINSVPPKGISLISESGYLMIAKVFDDDVAWKVQRQLVDNYFRLQNTNTQSNELTQELINILSSINDRLAKLEESITKKKLPEKKYSRWKSKAFDKLRKLQEFVNDNTEESLTLPNIIHLVIGETEDTYSIEVNDYVELYKSEMCLENNPYALDVISHYKDIRDMFTLTLDSIMEKLHIGGSRELNKKNIFDILAEEIKKEKEN